MAVTFSSGDDYQAGGGVTISSGTVQGTDTYSGGNDALAALAASANDPYEAELLQQAATGGSGGLLGAGFNLGDGGDSGQPSLAELQALTAINQSIRNQTGLGSVTPQQTFFALRDIARQSPTYQNLGFVQGLGGINVPSFNLANAQLMRPMSTGVNLSMSMMTPSGVRGIGQIPKAPVQDPVTGQYYVDGEPVDKQTAEYMMEVRDDVYGVLPDPKASFGSEMFGKVKSFFTGEEPDPAAGFKDYGTLLNMGGEIDPETGNITTKVGKGELKYNNRFGITTYSGPKDDSYRGPFENLIRPAYSSDDGPQQEEQVAIKPITEEEEERSMIRDGLIMPEGGYYPTTGRFLRLGLLDQPIDTYGGLLAGQDPAAFEAMNMAFRRPTNVEYFQDPYDMTGYTLI